MEVGYRRAPWRAPSRMHESRLQENFPESQVTGSGDLFGACSVVHLRAHVILKVNLTKKAAKHQALILENFWNWNLTTEISGKMKQFIHYYL